MLDLTFLKLKHVVNDPNEATQVPPTGSGIITLSPSTIAPHNAATTVTTRYLVYVGAAVAVILLL